MTTVTRRNAADPERLQQRARARAAAALIADDPPRLREFEVSGSPLRGAERRRATGSPPKPPRQTPRLLRRGAAVVLLVAQIAVLGALLLAPSFQVTNISIDGDRLLTREAVLSTAGLGHQSIFTVNGSGARDRLLALPWIRSATVTTQLPNKVSIHVVEWSPVLRLHRDGHDTLMADSGATIDASAGRPAEVAKIPVLIDERPAPAAKQPDATLVQMLDEMSTTFPKAFGCAVAAYEWRADQVLVIWTSTGWSAVLGHVAGQSEIAAIPQKINALAALKGTLDYVHPAFGYVNVENPAAPAVGGTPGLPAAITAALTFTAAPVAAAAVPKPAASAAPPTPPPTAKPTPAPTATPVPTSTPMVFNLH